MSKVVPTARFSPGKCALSGDISGPFLDTGKRVQGFGHIYLSIRFLDEHIRDAGYIKQEEASELREHNDALQRENEELQEKADDLDELVAAVSPYLPTPEPEVVEKPVVTHRAPTDEEIERWIEKKGGNHPVVRKARPYEPGSAEEWNELYGHRRERKTKTRLEQKNEAMESGSDNTEVTPDTTDEGPEKTFTIFDQEVNLDEVLNQNVSDIQAYAEGKGEEFEKALVLREFYLAKENNRRVRKGVLEPLGYWDEQDDEPLVPSDEDEFEDAQNDDGEDE